MSERLCSRCESNQTYIEHYELKSGNIIDVHHWRKDGSGGWLCDKCYGKYVKQPKWGPIVNPIRGPKRITFLGKRIRVDRPPRIGVCNWCRSVTPFDCKRTHMHHESYHDEDPLKDTIELCVSCHVRHSWEIKKDGLRST